MCGRNSKVIKTNKYQWEKILLHVSVDIFSIIDLVYIDIWVMLWLG